MKKVNTIYPLPYNFTNTKSVFVKHYSAKEKIVYNNKNDKLK